MPEKESQPERRRVGADLIIPVVGTVYAIYYVASVWDFPAEAQRSGLFLASLLIFLCLLLFLRTGLALARGTAVWDFGMVLGPEKGRAARFGFFLLILVYLAVVRWSGFTLTTMGFLFGASLLAGIGSARKAAIFAVLTSLVGYVFFILILSTRFPRGPFENLMTAVGLPWS